MERGSRCSPEYSAMRHVPTLPAADAQLRRGRLVLGDEHSFWQSKPKFNSSAFLSLPDAACVQATCTAPSLSLPVCKLG